VGARKAWREEEAKETAVFPLLWKDERRPSWPLVSEKMRGEGQEGKSYAWS
jgi:hypothetical protein